MDRWARRLGQFKQRGFTLFELVMVTIILLIMIAVSMPAFNTMMRNSLADVGVRQIAADIQDARSRAIRTGWQYRILGGNAGGSTSYKNQYRLEGRSSGAAAWPLATDGAIETSTKVAGQWINFSALFNNRAVSLNPSDADPDFFVVFDSRGAVIASSDVCPGVPSPCSFTLSVTRETMSRTVTVSSVGRVRIQ
jgi:prepilin-type N-terminal cleavage/methylation domain-containing protein